MNKLKKVPFKGDKILIVEKDDQRLVPMKPIVGALGLEWHKQFELINRDPVLSKVTVPITGIVAGDGKKREMLCLPMEYLNGWLFKIPAMRYTGCRQEAIIKYQRECYQALYQYFHKEKPYSDNMRKIISAITTEAAKKDDVIAALKTQVVRLLELIGVATSEPFVEGHRRCGGKCRQDTKTEFFRILRELLPDENQVKK